MGSCGMSIPLVSSVMLRNGVDEGQAPAQMPQLAHSEPSTTAMRAPSRLSGCGAIVTAAYGQSAKQRAQPLQFAGSTCATGAGRGCGSSGHTSNSTVSAPENSHTAAGDQV